jgi:hypothetical protein
LQAQELSGQAWPKAALHVKGWLYKSQKFGMIHHDLSWGLGGCKPACPFSFLSCCMMNFLVSLCS